MWAMSLRRVCPGLPGLLASWAGANVECWLLGHLSANSKWSHVLPVLKHQNQECGCRNFVDCPVASVVDLYYMAIGHTEKGKCLYGLVKLSTGEHLPQSKAFVHSRLWGSDAFLMDKTPRNVSLNGSQYHPTTFPVIVCEGNDFAQTRRLGVEIL